MNLYTALVLLFTWQSESSGGAAAAGSATAEALSWHSGIAAGTASRRLAYSSCLTPAPWLFLRIHGHVSIFQILYSSLPDSVMVPLPIALQSSISTCLGSENSPLLTSLLACTALMLCTQKLDI